jgi:hypothetical protein
MNSDFYQAMQVLGIVCKDLLIEDGKIHRFVNGGGRGSKDGWYIFFEGGGAFGDWSLNIHETWSSLHQTRLPPKHRAEISRQTAQACAKWRQEQKEAHVQVANTLETLLPTLSLTGRFSLLNA